jgi:hypothetical protein
MGGFYLDHDQRNTLATGVDATLPWHGYSAFDFNYGSGFLSADGPAHLPSYRTFDFVARQKLRGEFQHAGGSDEHYEQAVSA